MVALRHRLCERQRRQLNDPERAGLLEEQLFAESVGAWRRGERRRAVHLASRLTCSAFSHEWREYLKRPERYQGLLATPWSLAAFRAWNRTEFADAYRDHVLRMVRERWRPRVAADPAKAWTFVDVGCGDGVLTSAVVRSLAEGGAGSLTVVLVDQSPSALAATHELLQGVRTIPLLRDVRSLRVEEWTAPFSGGLALCSGVLHEVPRHEKAAVLKVLVQRMESCLVTELEGDHDSPRVGSVALAASVLRFYSALVRAVGESSLPRAAKREAVRSFLFPEALRILLNPRAARGNYHARRDEWEELLRAAGSIAFRHSHSLKPYGPSTLSFEVRRTP